MLVTSRGRYASYSQLRHAYMQAHDEHPPVENYLRAGGWDESLLHISDLASCPRKQMLRLSGAPKKRRSPETVANEALMFWQGNMIHALTAGALDWAGVLLDFERGLIGLPSGWTGHYDCIYEDVELEGQVLWDGKSVRPNAFDYRFDWPKHPHACQMGGYLLFEPDVVLGQIEYIDRGGSNRPVVCNLSQGGHYVDEALVLMDKLERCREALPELPPVLSPVYTASYYKQRGTPMHLLTGVKYGVSWECEWCDYLHGVQDKRSKLWTIDGGSPCAPEMRQPDFVAKYKDGRWKIDAGHEEGVYAFLENCVPEWQDEELETST